MAKYIIKGEEASDVYITIVRCFRNDENDECAQVVHNFKTRDEWIKYRDEIADGNVVEINDVRTYANYIGWIHFNYIQVIEG